MRRKSKSEIKDIERRINQMAKMYLDSTLDDVLAGTADAETMQYYCIVASMKIQKTFRNSAPETRKLMNAVCWVLTKIGEGEDPNVAFGLKKKGRTKKRAADDRMIALLVYQARLAGHTIKDACCSTYNHLIDKNLGRGLSYERIREIYYQHEDDFNNKYNTLS